MIPTYFFNKEPNSAERKPTPQEDFFRKYQSGTIYISPINEISFFAWIGADRGVWAPYTKGSRNGLIFKKQLVKASLAAMKAIWEEDSSVRFLHPDPFMERYPAEPASKKAIRHAQEFNTVTRFEAWDMIAGKAYPELGGEPKYLDIVGINYYFHNQEFVASEGENKINHITMKWNDPYRTPFWQLLTTIYDRYKKPMVVSETGSYGNLRSKWWERTLTEIDESLYRNLPLYGVCAYPTVDRPDSVNYLLRRSGLWDFANDDPQCLRIPHKKSLEVIKKYIDYWAT